jgi:uncharacterized surface protein with fasciclin (FAS1) repeats
MPRDVAQGEVMTVTSNATGVFVGGTGIAQHDLLASNGVMHTIDSYMQARPLEHRLPL